MRGGVRGTVGKAELSHPFPGTRDCGMREDLSRQLRMHLLTWVPRLSAVKDNAHGHGHVLNNNMVSYATQAKLLSTATSTYQMLQLWHCLTQA